MGLKENVIIGKLIPAGSAWPTGTGPRLMGDRVEPEEYGPLRPREPLQRAVIP